MLTLGSLPLLAVNRSYAFFKTEEGLVDFCTFNLSVLVIVFAISCAFTAGQIYQKQFSTFLDALLLYLYLTDSVGATGSVV